MRRWLLLLTLLMPLGAAAQLPPLAARLTVEVQEQQADGVLRSSRYSELFYRQGGQVWSQRELQAWALEIRARRSAHELDLGSAPRWIRELAGGAASLALIDPAQRRLYAIAPSEHERTSFSGRWAASASLLDPAALKKMQKLPKAGRAGAVWYGREDAQGYERVLWDAARAFPLEVESGRRDGRGSARTSVQFQALPVKWPWDAVGDYTKRELSDLAD